MSKLWGAVHEGERQLSAAFLPMDAESRSFKYRSVSGIKTARPRFWRMATKRSIFFIKLSSILETHAAFVPRYTPRLRRTALRPLRHFRRLCRFALIQRRCSGRVRRLCRRTRIRPVLRRLRSVCIQQRRRIRRGFRARFRHRYRRLRVFVRPMSGRRPSPYRSR